MATKLKSKPLTEAQIAEMRGVISDQVADKIMSRIAKNENTSAIKIMRDEIESLLVHMNYTGVTS